MNEQPVRNTHEELIKRLLFLGQMSSSETALFHQRVADSMGLGITDTKTMSVLMQEGSMTAGQLAQRLNLTTGAVTNLLDRLEKRGIVSRMADENDRRKVIVKINMKNVAKHGGAKAYESMGRAYSQLLTAYTDRELEFLVAYLENQLEVTKQEIARLTKIS